MNKKHLILAAFLMAESTVWGAVNIRQLHSGWRFRQGSSEIWHEAEVPGNVHLDLMRNRLLDDPFFRMNERSCQWVDKEDWMYETYITPTAEELNATNQEIVFKGLDTYADVYLNHRQLVRANNMHREWRCDVKGILKEGENLLEVYFHSPIKLNLPKWDALPYQHNTGPDHSQTGGVFNKGISIFARTAGYEYGWDWGPRLVTSGIWRAVQLETWSGAKIADAWHIQNQVSQRQASLTSVIEVLADADMANAEIKITADGKLLARKRTALKKGLNKVSVDFTMKKPRLWWTNGLGEPYLYNFVTTLNINGNAADMVFDEIGIRSLKLHNDKDEHGRCLYFELNGQPLFAKGSNMVPNDNFLTRCNDSVYERVVLDAKAVNMNIIRVWGGGIYEDDAFYKHCDRNGILVWQDFMFACSTYPADSTFLSNVREEAVYNLRRLRNHACLAVLAGNNECQDVWFGWGGKKKQLDEMGYGDEVGKMQHDLFYKVLPEAVAECTRGIAYRPSCPWAFEDTPSDGVNGDDHYWGVWHGGDPIEAYFDHHVRFESEYGFQAFPEYESVLKYAPYAEDHNIYSEVMMNHQKAGTYANHRIEEYMRRDYRVPADFKQFLYVGMILQGDAVKNGMEAFRRDRPYCMGSIVWQLNDCWPVASWSSRDYYGRWKVLHYFTKKAYDDILVSPRIVEKGERQTLDSKQTAALPSESNSKMKAVSDTTSSGKQLEIKLVSDRLEAAKGDFTVRTLTLDGREVCKASKRMTLPANTATDVATLDVDDILGGERPENVIFRITFDTGSRSYYNIAYAVRQKDMAYTRPNISVSVAPNGDGYDVTLTTDIFARGVFLAIKGIDNFFEDNYFDMLPKSSRTIHVRTDKDMSVFKGELEITTLADTF